MIAPGPSTSQDGYPLTIPTPPMVAFSHDYDTQKRQQAASFPSQKHPVKQTTVDYQFRP